MTSSSINLRSLASAPQFKQEVFKLINDNFPQGHECSRNISTQEEFPILLQDINSNRVLFLERDGEVISTCSWAPFTFDLGKCKIKTAAMGLICTSEKNRKQGFSSYLLSEAEKLAKTENACISFLWSADPTHYQKLGYIVSGFEYQWKIEKSKLNSAEFEANHKTELIKDFKQTEAIHNRRSHGPERDFEIYNNYLKLPDTYMIRTEKSYAFMGKARDLHNCIHELQGDAEDFPKLMSRLKANIDEDHFYIQLPMESKFSAKVESYFGEGQRGGYALTKVLDGANLVDKMLRSSKTPDDVDIEVTDISFSISKNSSTVFASNDFAHFIQLFMGPLRIDEFEDLNDAQKEILSSLDVAKLYFWGFDSI